MIKINVLNGLMSPKIKKLLAETEAVHRAKSFSGRNPHLGKMINCVVCGTRHFSSKVCELVYAIYDRNGNPYYEDLSPMRAPLPDQPRTPFSDRNAIFGAAMFAKKRLAPHRHPRDLEIKDMAERFFDEEQAFNEAFEVDQDTQVDMTACVRDAQAIVGDSFRRKRKHAMRQADISRRINRGLARNGARA